MKQLSGSPVCLGSMDSPVLLDTKNKKSDTGQRVYHRGTGIYTAPGVNHIGAYTHWGSVP